VNKIVFIPKLLLICVVFLLAFNLRLKNYSTIPFPGQSVDEYSNSWVGLSIIKLGVPVGISGLSGYENNFYRYVNVDRIYQNGNATDGSPMPINYPWFDHPPLMGLLTGGWAYLKGGRVFEDTTTSIIRKPMIILGSISVVLLYLLVDINFGVWPALISGVIYAISPLTVISSRMIQAENGFIPLFLLAIIFYSLYKNRNKFIFYVFSCIVSGVAILFKLSALSITLSIFLLTIYDFCLNKNKSVFIKKIILLFTVTFCFLSVFVIWGWFYDWDQFINIFMSNSVRPYELGLNLLINLFSQSKITGKNTLFDPFYYWGWVAIVYLWRDFKKYRIVLVPVVSYMIVYIFFGSQPYGWYSYPFFPFLMTMFSLFLIKIKSNLLIFVCAISIFGFYLSKLLSYSDFLNISFYWRTGLVLVATIMFMIDLIKKNKFMLYGKILNWLVLFAGLFLAIKYQNLFTIDYWYKVF